MAPARFPGPRLVEPLAEETGFDSYSLGSIALRIVDPEMQRVFAQIRRLAAGRVPVLISGESGAGKEIAAKAIHGFSQRAGGPLVPINCGAIPAGLIETELFGYERGAFSGARSHKPGLLETAEGGTVFLDEIGELPLELQTRLLRFLDDHVIRRVGALRLRPVDVRVVAATNRDLAAEVREGRFRDDLFYRLSAATVRVPALRERTADIPLLAQDLLDAAREANGRPGIKLSPHALMSLVRYSWPGNVRELKHVMELVALGVEGGEVMLAHLVEIGFAGAAPETVATVPHRDVATAQRTIPLSEQVAAFERKAMIDALDATGWVQHHAARLLGVPRRTFVTKLKRYGITRRR